MRAYILRRLLLIIPTLFGISVITFSLLQFVPGGPVEQAMARIRGVTGEQGMTASASDRVTEEEFEYLRQFYGFDKPVHVRYLIWLSQALRFDFGDSFRFQRPVTEVIFERFPISLTFGIISFVLSYLICIPLGVTKALHHRDGFDTGSSIAIYAGYSVPGFALGVLLLLVFAGGNFLNIFPLSGATSDNFASLSFPAKILDFAHHMILPVICYVIGNFARLTTLMKNSLMEELNRDYMKTALSKGVPYSRAVITHALRNALVPLATGFGSILLLFFAGSMLIETVFNIQGIGLLSYRSIVARDYPMVMGLLMIQSALILVGQLLSDVSYVVIDPRISFGK